MRRFALIGGIGCLWVLAAGCHARPPGRVASMVAPGVLEKASLKVYWQASARLGVDESVRRVWQLDENLYALTSTGRLIALDAAVGTYKWDRRVAGPTQRVFDPCHADDVLLPVRVAPVPAAKPPPGEEKEGEEEEPIEPAEPPTKSYRAVIINTLSYALVIDRDNGDLLRRLELGFAANSPGSSDGSSLYLGSVKGWYYALRLDNGVPRWTMATGDLISARPVCHDNRLYVASHDGCFYAIQPNLDKDRHLWTRQTDAPLTAGFVVDSRGCFVPGQDYMVYAYDGLSGDELWAFRTGGPLMQPVQVGIRTVYQFAENDRFYAIDLATGRKRWELPDGRQVLATAEAGALSGVAHDDQPYVFVLTADRHLLMIPEMLGEVEVKIPMTGLDLFVPNARKPVIYAATAGGLFVCLAPRTLEYLKPEMLKD